jgi:Uma2 family endonuclease
MIDAELTPTLTATAETPVSEKLSFHDYLSRYSSYEGGRTEWIAGAVAVYTMANNTNHQRLLKLWLSLLDLFVSIRSLGEVFPAGLPMYVGEDKPAREPDLMIVFTSHLERIKPTYLDGIADIVIEIVSPESASRDRGDKFIEYEALGVPEYWLFDPLRQDAGIYALGSDGVYRRVPLDAAGRLTSTLLPGFALDPALLWQEPLPDATALIGLVQSMA